ncbi:MAG: ankyrin repeat domain-containing protein [Rickettsiaceae bacterium]|nr:ankyrin repeat domain-containing protein [Rickettsiaceae bacterium]
MGKESQIEDSKIDFGQIKNNVETLTEYSPDLSKLNKEQKKELLKVAAKHNRVKLIQKLVDDQTSTLQSLLSTFTTNITVDNSKEDFVNSVDKNGQTALHYAASSGSVDAIKALISHGSKVDVADNSGRTPIFSAASSGSVDAIKLFLDRGLEPNALDKDKRSPLHYAASSGSAGAIKLFLSKGLDPNALDSENRSPLHYAVNSGDIDTINALITDANVNRVDTHGHTPLDYAISQGKVDVIKALIERGAIQNSTALLKAKLQEENEESIELLNKLKESFPDLKLEIDFSTETDLKGRLLLKAAKHNHAFAAKALLEMHADPNVKDQEGKTALRYAVEKGNKELVEELLKQVADPNVKDQEGKTAIDYAKESKDQQLLEAFQDKASQNTTKPEQATENTEQNLHEAVKQGNKELVEELLKQVADPNTKDKDGKTPIFYVSRGQDDNSIAIRELLFSKGAHVRDALSGDLRELKNDIKKIARRLYRLGSLPFTSNKNKPKSQQHTR